MTAIRGTTGTICQVSGVYQCQLHTWNTIPLSKGERFPPCSAGNGHATTWVLVKTA
ncbi:MAG: hypothetical protein ACKVT2_02825 [Saprospiraceae bacterium]